MGRLNILVVKSLKPSCLRRSHHSLAHFFCFTLGILAASGVPAFANEASGFSPKLITKASQIRSMTTEQAKQGRPVHLVGVITYYDPDEPDLFIQDSSAGIWVNLEVVKPNVPISTGDLVEIQG